jgi:hypothetical protein
MFFALTETRVGMASALCTEVRNSKAKTHLQIETMSYVQEAFESSWLQQRLRP